jgi:hypothetical protein
VHVLVIAVLVVATRITVAVVTGPVVDGLAMFVTVPRVVIVVIVIVVGAIVIGTVAGVGLGVAHRGSVSLRSKCAAADTIKTFATVNILHPRLASSRGATNTLEGRPA